MQQEKLKNEQNTSGDHQNFGADSPIENRDKNQIQQLSDQSIDDLKVDHGGQMTGDQADGLIAHDAKIVDQNQSKEHHKSNQEVCQTPANLICS